MYKNRVHHENYVKLLFYLYHVNEEIQQQTEQEELFKISTDFILKKKKILPKPILHIL